MNFILSKMKFLLLMMLAGTVSMGNAWGGEKASFLTPQMAPNVSHRQNVCDRYDQFHNGTVELKDALEGLQLNVIVGDYTGSYFNYDEATGIDPTYPGLTAVILDELAQRAKFTWRDSFGIFVDEPEGSNVTFDEFLLWGTQAYDLVADRFTQTNDRMKEGVAFVESWYDSSIILIGKQLSEESSSEINLWAWLKPYDLNVWMMTVFTILLSGLVYQILEWYADERNDRTLWEWWLENAYLSAINFTQAYEYQPTTLASRIFGISMAIWALVMTATYTANLASLLVVKQSAPLGPQTLEEVVLLQLKICVWHQSSADTYIQDNFLSAKLIHKQTMLEVYEGLQDGECDYLVDGVANWNRFKAMKAYNPHCDLYWVGGDRIISYQFGGLTTKADSGNLCTGLIQDVLNIHMLEMIDAGFLSDAWEREHSITQDIDCDIYKPGLVPVVASPENNSSDLQSPNKGNSTRRHLLKSNRQRHQGTKVGGKKNRRDLKAGAGATGGAAVTVSAAAAGGGGGSQTGRLSVDEMMGTFVFHWGLMAIALILAIIKALHNRHVNPKKRIGGSVPLCESGSTPEDCSSYAGQHEESGAKCSDEATATTTRSDSKQAKETSHPKEDVAQLHLQQKMLLLQLLEINGKIEILTNAGQTNQTHNSQKLDRSTINSSSLIRGEIPEARPLTA